MNQEQLNAVADIYNESKLDLVKKGEYTPKEDKKAEVVSSIISCMSCYLYVYKDLYPDTYDITKKVLQNIVDLITLGVDVETCQAKEGEFSFKENHLIYLGEYK